LTRNEVILGLAALVLVAFSLFVALVVPRWKPDFPGRGLRVFTLVSILLVAGMLSAVEVFGEEDHVEREAGAGEVKDTAPGDTGTTVQTTSPTATLPPETTETGGGLPEGDPEAGAEVFNEIADPTCGSCHTLSAAGAAGTLGPNLDESLQGDDADSIEEAIVDPNAEITEGFQEGVMPEDYGEKLSSQQIADLVAFLAESAG
jgi:mono/diheme cytochrome c family protein